MYSKCSICILVYLFFGLFVFSLFTVFNEMGGEACKGKTDGIQSGQNIHQWCKYIQI